MSRNFLSRLSGNERDAAWQALGDGRPLKRVGLPEEVVPLAIFLASEEASFITGVDYFVDGGRHRRELPVPTKGIVQRANKAGTALTIATIVPMLEGRCSM